MLTQKLVLLEHEVALEALQPRVWVGREPLDRFPVQKNRLN